MLRKKEMANQEIRNIISEAGLRHFEIFDELKISQPTWTRLIARPLSKDDKQLILGVIKKLKAVG